MCITMYAFLNISDLWSAESVSAELKDMRVDFMSSARMEIQVRVSAEVQKQSVGRIPFSREFSFFPIKTFK